ncbi:MAG: radical SAM protein [Candidatus Altiarchaeota archaeon]
MFNYKELLIIPTKKCNFRCEHCGVKKIIRNKEISISSVRKSLAWAREIGIKKVHITGGGEPLIAFGKVCEIIKLSKEKGFYVLLVSNGSLLSKNPKLLDKLAKEGLDELCLSFDYDHLKFISYSKFLDLMRYTLNSKIERVTLKVCSRPKTIERNYLLIKKLFSDLNLDPSKVKYSLLSEELDNYVYIISNQKIIKLQCDQIHKTNAQKRDIDFFKLYDLNHLVYSLVSDVKIAPTPVIDDNSNILACAGFVAMNNPKYFSLGKINRNYITINHKNRVLSVIMNDFFPFLRIFLAIRKDKKLLKRFLNKKYYICCDFCFEALKNSKKIEQLGLPSNTELAKFLILDILLNPNKFFRLFFRYYSRGRSLIKEIALSTYANYTHNLYKKLSRLSNYLRVD